jgi:hypothetical protein
MGSLFCKPKPETVQTPKPSPKDSIQNVDVVKSKLKINRDKLNNMVKAKNIDI